MPTYEYHCETCGLDFEIEQSFSEETLTRCPTKKSGRSPEGCKSSGRGKVVKVFSAPGITFKGSGFYKTDARGSSGGSSSEGSSGSGDTSSSTSSSSTDSSGSSGSSDTSGSSESSSTSSASSTSD